MNEQVAYGEIHNTLDELGAPPGSTTAMRIRALAAGFERSKASLMDALAFARKERDDALTALGQMTTRAAEEEQRATRATAEINAVRDALDGANIPYADTPAKRIREITLHAASTLAAARAGLDTAMAERSEFIRQRDEALGRVIATTALIDAAEKREAEALDELNAAEQALTDAAVTDGETLSDRIRELATRAAKYHGALAGANGERDESLRHLRETREVLHREREERATEKATLGAALQALRAETDTLGDSVDRLHEENERLAAQLEFAERVLIAGIRRATP